MTGIPRTQHVHRLHIGTCDVTGKRQYTDRKRAKAVARQLGGGLSVFRCDHCPYWHLGHRGDISREQHREHARGLRLEDRA